MINRPERYKVEQADWALFYQLTCTNAQLAPHININEAVKNINIIINSAEIAIPKSINTLKKPPIPWFNQEYKEAVKVRNRAERVLKQSHTIENKISCNRHKARCRYIFNNARRNCFRTYITSINQRTKLSEKGKKVNKISGKFT